MKVYEVIMSHRESPEDSVWCRVEAATPGSAQDECNEAVSTPGGLFEGYEFTIWPTPVQSV